MAELTDIRETVRKRYADAASAAARGRYEDARALEAKAGCCSPGAVTSSPADETDAFGAGLYDQGSCEEVPDAAISASLGCGVPTAVADLHDGDTVLDLGSGAGADVLISARRVAPTGKAIGLDMTDEMLELARANAREAGVANVEFVKGYLENMPLADETVDVVISNCVIDLSGDKPKTIAEAARVLRPGGRFAISDVIADPDMDEQTRADMAAWTGCIAGALTEAEFRSILASAGLEGIEIQPTRKVHEHASSAIVRGRKPAAAGCCYETTRATCCDRRRRPTVAARAAPRAPAAASHFRTRQPAESCWSGWLEAHVRCHSDGPLSIWPQTGPQSLRRNARQGGRPSARHPGPGRTVDVNARASFFGPPTRCVT
jgi:SAM-dependent methyltransferase